MGEKLTKRQRQTLDFISEFETGNGYAPSYREIADHFGLSSPATAFEHVKALEEKGFLKTEPAEARSIELVRFKPNWVMGVELSLAGLITAGEPIEAIEENNQTITVPADLAPNREESFVLQVMGDSMIGDGILDGDLAVCERAKAAQDGDTVVALIDNSYATLKRFYREAKGGIRLQPANPKYAPLFPQMVEIQGIVRGVIRKYA